VRSTQRAVSAIGVRHLFHNIYDVAVYSAFALLRRTRLQLGSTVSTDKSRG